MGVYINMEMPKCCAECDAEGHYENSYGDEYPVPEHRGAWLDWLRQEVEK